jgi:hypothetical protein
MKIGEEERGWRGEERRKQERRRGDRRGEMRRGKAQV